MSAAVGAGGPDSRPSGQVVGGFEILAKIGQGGAGAVFKARQITADRIVALKVLAPRLAKNQAVVERFLREARALASFSHPNIVHGIAAGQSDGYYYFAMEYVEGTSLQALLGTAGAVAEKKALQIARDVARALEAAHAAQVVHCDVKPGNILIAANGAVKLVDLGLACGNTGGDGGSAPAGAALGTPAYVAPEQARANAEIDGRADIYALGATLYHMLTGIPPYGGSSANEIISMHLTAPPPDPRTANPYVSLAASAIVRKAMAKDPAGRYPTAAHLLAAIESALGVVAPAAPRPAYTAPAALPDAAPARDLVAEARRRRHRSQRIRLALGLGALAVTAGVFGGIVWFAEHARRPGGEPGTAAKSTSAASAAVDHAMIAATQEAEILYLAGRRLCGDSRATLADLQAARSKFNEAVQKDPAGRYGQLARDMLPIVEAQIAPLEEAEREKQERKVNEEEVRRQQEERKRSDAVRLAAEQRLQSFRSKLPDLFRARKYKELVEQLETMIAAPEFAPVQQAARKDQTVIRKLAALMDRACANAQAGVGSTARYHGMPATIKSVDGEVVTFNVGKPEPIWQMLSADIEALLDLKPEADEVHHEGIALLYVSEGREDQAKPHLASLKDRSDVDHLRSMLARPSEMK